MPTPSTPPRGLPREEAQALAGLTALLAITAAWWALALWPVSGGAPEWLARTREVCFGVGNAGNGLPDGGGWIGLIGGPLGMLGILMVGWARGVAGLARRARRSRVTAAALGTLAIGSVLLVTGASVRVQQARAAGPGGPGGPRGPGAGEAWSPGDPIAQVPETYPRLDRPAPPLALEAHSGGTFELGDVEGRPVILTFAYAHCATICPVLVQNALRAREALAGTAVEPAVVVVTLDPWRDTPSRLPVMARDWGFPEEGAWVLGGSVEAVEAALDAWGVPRTRDTMNGAVTHPSLTYILDRTGRIAYATTGEAGTLVALLPRI